MNHATGISTNLRTGNGQATTNAPTNAPAAAPTNAPTNAPTAASAASASAERAAVVQRWLRANAAFSAVTGVVATIDAGQVADGLGIGQAWLVRAVGVGLLGFAMMLTVTARQSPAVLRRVTPVISVADFGWVLGTAVVIGFGWLSDGGSLVMALVAVVVLVLGVAQLRSARAMEAATEPAAETGPAPA